MNKPFVSVVMPVFNCEQFVAEAIKSIFNQSYDGPIELIVVDDGSTDRSAEIIRNMQQEAPIPMRVIPLSKNRGVSGAVQAGIDEARGEWIILADADDIHYPNRCKAAVNLAERFPKAGLICMSLCNVDEKGSEYGYTSYGGSAYAEVPDETYLETPEERCENLDSSCGKRKVIAWAGAMAIKRDLCMKWGPLWEKGTSERFAQDPTWELRALLSFPVVGSKVLACRYRSHSGNLLNRTFHTEDAAEWLRQRELMIYAYNKESPV